MIRDLAAAYHATVARGVRLAAVGPRFVDRRHAPAVEYPFMRLRKGWPRAVGCEADADAAGLVATDFLITSGCMIGMSAYDGVGAFDNDMFVDCTDMEWGFRALARGYRLYGVCSAIMSHELGAGEATSVMGLTLLGYTPVRRYYYARNTIRLLRLSYPAVGWKLRLAIGLLGRLMLLPFAPRSEQGWQREWKMLMRGVRDGLTGVGGPLIMASGD